jgi:hypothetical protein
MFSIMCVVQMKNIAHVCDEKEKRGVEERREKRGVRRGEVC